MFQITVISARSIFRLISNDDIENKPCLLIYFSIQLPSLIYMSLINGKKQFAFNNNKKI